MAENLAMESYETGEKRIKEELYLMIHELGTILPF
jgi:hypothetical protein